MKTTGYLFRIGVVVGVVLAGVMGIGAIRDRHVQSSLLRKGLNERAVASVSFVQSGIEKALRTDDDILMLIQLESLSRTEDVQAAYILDRAGKVTMHTRTSEWGHAYKDTYSRASVAATRPLFQEINVPHSYVYSVPVSTDAVLCVSYSAQKIDQTLSTVTRRFIYSGLTLFIIAFLIVYAFAMRPLRREIALLKAALKGIVPGTVSRVPPLQGECGEIASLVNSLFDQSGAKISPFGAEAIASSVKTVRAFFAAQAECVALFDTENRLIAATLTACDFFQLKDAEGKHIIELLSPEIITLAQEAQQHPDTAVRRAILENTIECSVVTDDKKAPAGLVIRKISA